MIDGSEKCKRQLVFELQSSRVYEKRSNLYQRKTIFVTKSIRIQKKNNVGKRKTGVLKRMLIRDLVDLHFVLSNIKQNFSSFKTP